MSEKISLLLLLLLISSSALAQKTIRGTITDAKTGETLPSTNILIENTYRGTITNANGNMPNAIQKTRITASIDHIT